MSNKKLLNMNSDGIGVISRRRARNEGSLPRIKIAFQRPLSKTQRSYATFSAQHLSTDEERLHFADVTTDKEV